MSGQRTLVVTNDFPPRIGGIESFVADVCRLLGDDVVVLTRQEPDAQGTKLHDRSLRFEVVRLPGPLLPTPSVQRSAVHLLRSSGATRVVFGAAAPLGLLAPALRSAGAHRILGLTHGHEVWWATVPFARQLLRRIAAHVDHLGVISSYTANRIGPALNRRDRNKLVRLPPPIDLDQFSPTSSDPGPVVLAAGRLVRQKGFTTLLAAWPQVLAKVGDARLDIVGSGPLAPRLRAAADGLTGVRLLGPVPHEQTPALYRGARVFALPVSTRFAGLNPEGLGLVFCEAAACGLPVVVGRSGGAPETVLDGVSGTVVDPTSPEDLAEALVGYLADPDLARRRGAAGRAHIERNFSLTRLGDALRHCLDLASPQP